MACTIDHMTNTYTSPDQYEDSNEFAGCLEEWLYNHADHAIIRACQASPDARKLLPAHISDPAVTGPEEWVEFVGNADRELYDAVNGALFETVAAIYSAEPGYWDEACEWAHWVNVNLANEMCGP